MLMKGKAAEHKEAVAVQAKEPELKERPPKELGAKEEPDNRFVRYQRHAVQWTDVGRDEWQYCPSQDIPDQRHPRLVFSEPVQHVRVHMEDMTSPGDVHWD